MSSIRPAIAPQILGHTQIWGSAVLPCFRHIAVADVPLWSGGERLLSAELTAVDSNEEFLSGRPRKPKVIAQCLAGVLDAESATTLQDRHDMIDERRKFMRQCRSHERESVDRTCILPSDHMSGQLLGCANEMRTPGASARRPGDLA